MDARMMSVVYNMTAWVLCVIIALVYSWPIGILGMVMRCVYIWNRNTYYIRSVKKEWQWSIEHNLKRAIQGNKLFQLLTWSHDGTSSSPHSAHQCYPHQEQRSWTGSFKRSKYIFFNRSIILIILLKFFTIKHVELWRREEKINHENLGITGNGGREGCLQMSIEISSPCARFNCWPEKRGSWTSTLAHRRDCCE